MTDNIEEFSSINGHAIDRAILPKKPLSVEFSYSKQYELIRNRSTGSLDPELHSRVLKTLHTQMLQRIQTKVSSAKKARFSGFSALGKLRKKLNESVKANKFLLGAKSKSDGLFLDKRVNQNSNPFLNVRKSWSTEDSSENIPETVYDAQINKVRLNRHKIFEFCERTRNTH